MAELENTHKNKHVSLVLVGVCVFLREDRIYFLCEFQKKCVLRKSSMSLCFDPHVDETFKGLYRMAPKRSTFRVGWSLDFFRPRRLALTCPLGTHYPFQPISIFIFWWNKLFFFTEMAESENMSPSTHKNKHALSCVGGCVFFFGREIKFISSVNSRKSVCSVQRWNFQGNTCSWIPFHKKCVFHCRNTVSWSILFCRNGRIGKHESTHTQNIVLSCVGGCVFFFRGDKILER